MKIINSFIRKRKKFLFIGVICVCLLNPIYSNATIKNNIRVMSNNLEYSRVSSKLNSNCEETSQSGRIADRLLIVNKGKLDLSGIKGIQDAISNGDNLCVIQFQSAEYAKSAFENLQKNSAVESVEYDCKYEVASAKSMENYSIVNASHLSWGPAYIGVDEYKQNLLNNGNNITVAVVDTGVEKNHTFLKSKLIDGYDFVYGDNTPEDGDGHGTHVAGIIADCTDGINSIKIMPVRVLDEKAEGNTLDIANGFLYASERNAEIINASLGGPHSNYLDNAVNTAISNGSIAIVASGNEGEALDKLKHCPAHIEKAVTVGAVRKSGLIELFSNYGKYLDLVAPGQDINSSYLNNTYAVLSGTSMATPFVSAAAALINTNYGELSNDEMTSIIYRSCDKNANVNKFGKGIINLKNLVANINKCSIKLSSSGYTYNGNYIRPAVTVTQNSQKLFENSDYTTSYSNNYNVGSGKIFVNAAGTYNGTVTKTFNIIPKGTSISKVSGGKKALTIKWKKQSSKMSKNRINGYQVQYSRSSKFSSGNKTKTIKGYSKTSCKVSKLKSRKKYYVRVRTYMKVNGKTYYSKWSNKKYSKTK